MTSSGTTSTMYYGNTTRCVSSDRNKPSSQSWQVNYTETKRARIANYGDPKMLDNCPANNSSSSLSTTKSGKLPTADDISSDEEDDPHVNNVSANPATQFDNVSDISENSVHDQSAQQLDSDDILSDALSADDALDYDELCDEFHELPAASVFPTNDPLSDSDNEDKRNKTFVNSSIGRTKISTIHKGQQAIATETVLKSCLKAPKPPSNVVLPQNSAKSDDKNVIKSQPESSAPNVNQESKAQETSREKALAVITVRHVQEIFKVISMHTKVSCMLLYV